jgi:hypothetical protein
MLRGIRERFQKDYPGENFDVGDLENVEGELSQLVEGREPVELLARVLAHVAHRIPGLRRIERRLEGQEPSSGIGSDLLALATVLYLRNRGIIEKAARNTRERAKAAQAAKNGAPPPGTSVGNPDGEVEIRVPEGVN